ncbi:MAG: hypothetical protein ACK5UC_15500 [Planctomycetaceae bacterium]
MTQPAASHSSRREFLQQLAVGGLGPLAASSLVPQSGLWGALAQPVTPKPVAAILTHYFTGSHADVLVGKILEGWQKDGGPGPALSLKAMYVDQFHNNDVAREMAKKHNVPIVNTIEEALTLGGKSIAVDGVLSIGEHGHYQSNAKGQTLYPRRRFLHAITQAFEKHGRVVPVFNDKHLGPEWDDILWMYRRVRELKVPFMAGSSLPVGFRDPDPVIPLDSEIEEALVVGYSGLDIYGLHALECLQCLVERRRGGERGVKRVRCLTGDALWQAVDGGVVDRELLQAALKVVPHAANVDPRQGAQDPALFQFEYVDGFQGRVLMLPAYVGGNGVAVKLRGQAQPVATRFEERLQPHYPHFAYLLKAIERMIHTGRPSYPVERTLLTSGVLDRALTSRVEESRWIDTPELQIAYTPVDYPHAPHPDLLSSPLEPLS